MKGMVAPSTRRESTAWTCAGESESSAAIWSTWRSVMERPAAGSEGKGSQTGGSARGGEGRGGDDGAVRAVRAAWLDRRRAGWVERGDGGWGICLGVEV